MSADAAPQRRPSLVTRALTTAPPWAFALYGGLAAFAAYFSMFAYRKPFTAAHYEHVAGWPLAIDFKVALVIAQVAGYAVSKIIGIKVISEMRPERRWIAILVLIGGAELSLLGLSLAPPVLGPVALFVNGLCLGMIWGLVFGFVEGRRVSEVLGAMLCASFILASGVVKSVGKSLLLQGVDERWMPALTGLLFTPLLLVAVAALTQLPPPSPADEAARVRRAPMDAKARAAMFAAHAPALILLVAVYVLLTALRDFRDNFAAEIWAELGYKNAASIFSLSEIPVAAIVLVGMGLLMLVRDNRRAVGFNLGFVALGFALLGLATLGHQLGLLGPVAWMIATGAGIYMAYTPFNGVLFDRLIAATGRVGTAGFLIYVADSFGYIGSVSLLLARYFADLELAWSGFLAGAAYFTSVIGVVGVGAAWMLLKLPKSGAAASDQTLSSRT
uniref:Major facilitator superfamily MFS_1 n=1 Tax=Caulobacter sp. (strain K31) TaxID=366602 RepID=B0SZY6_CAUSK